MGQTDYNENDTEYPVSRSDFRYFRSRFLHWAKRLSLNEWEWFFYHRFDEENAAFITCNIEGRNVSVSLSTRWRGVKPTKRQLDLAALHEACEVLTMPLQDCAKSRWITEREVDVASHSIIRRLEHLVFGDDQ